MAAAVLLGLLAGACGELGDLIPGGPSDTSLEGTWHGQFNSASAGLGTATATLLQVGTLVSGNWTVFGPNETTTGAITGYVAGSSTSLTRQASGRHGCAMLIVATFTSTTLQGTWSTSGCTEQEVGSFILTRV